MIYLAIAFTLTAALVALVDLQKLRIPYWLTLPLLGLGLALSFYGPFPWWQGWAIAGALWLLMMVLTICAGMGDADAVVLAAFGAALGPWVAPVLAIAAIGGAGLGLIAGRRRFPYAPVIVVAGVVVFNFTVFAVRIG